MLPKAVPKFFALIQDQTSFGLREQFDAIVLSIPFTIATYLVTTEMFHLHIVLDHQTVTILCSEIWINS